MRTEDGISPDIETRKSRVILDMVFSEGCVSVDEILSCNGIDRGEFADWLRDDIFFGDLCDLSGRVGEAELARVVRCLVELAKEGDVKAAKAIRSLFVKSSSDVPSSGVKVAETIEKYKSLDREIFGEEYGGS